MSTAVASTPAAQPSSTPAAPAESKSLLDASQATTEGAGQEGGSLLDEAFSNVDGAKGQPSGNNATPDKANPSAAQKQEPSKDGKPDANGSGAPEKYADFKLPEGMTLDTSMTQEFSGIAKELNLSQEAAQKLVDLQAKFVQGQATAQLAAFKQISDGWKQESLQSLGSDYKAKLGVAAKAIDRFGGPGLRQILNESGLGNHKEVITAFYNAGQAISEDGFVEGDKGGKAPKSAASVLYPNLGKQT